MQTGKTYCYKMIQKVINTVHIDSLVNPMRKAQFKSLPKNQEISRARGWEDTEEIQDYNHLLWTSNPGGKNVSSPFLLVHQIFLPVPVLRASKKNEVFVSSFSFIYSFMSPKARSLMQWKLPLETLQHHVKSHNEVLPYHVKLLAVENERLLS